MTRACSGSLRSFRARASIMKPARACRTSSSSRRSRACRPAARAALAPPAHFHRSSTSDFWIRNPITSVQLKTPSETLQLQVELMLRHKPPLKPCGDRGRPLDRNLDNDSTLTLYIFIFNVFICDTHAPWASKTGCKLNKNKNKTASKHRSYIEIEIIHRNRQCSWLNAILFGVSRHTGCKQHNCKPHGL